MQPVVLEDADLEEIVRLADGDGSALRLLERLPPDQRDAITARILDERSYEDIAAELECSQAVIRQRVHRGLSVMRQRLEGRK
ncbi:MAG TPA: sigma factor-like helix-turn-helix DNA-binding protein [Solirubrobacter sp.]|nr:sigma factor-like helix-turn-helix DNA-binding protein [Solirubrobacter sp.]